jgi:hypothetical protein
MASGCGDIRMQPRNEIVSAPRKVAQQLAIEDSV